VKRNKTRRSSLSFVHLPRASCVTERHRHTYTSKQALSSTMTPLRRVAAPLLLILSMVTAFVPSAPTSHRTISQLSAEITLDGETIRGPITPLGNFVLVSIKDSLSATSGGILLPDQVRFVYMFYAVICTKLHYLHKTKHILNTFKHDLLLCLHAEYRIGIYRTNILEQEKVQRGRGNCCWTREASSAHWRANSQPGQGGDVCLVWRILWRRHGVQR
jgi:hypothetical protein